MCFFETKRLCVNSGMIKMTDIWHLMCRPHWSRRTQTRRYAFILSKILRLLTFACRAQIYQLFCRTGSLCPKYCASSPLLAGLKSTNFFAGQAHSVQNIASPHLCLQGSNLPTFLRDRLTLSKILRLLTFARRARVCQTSCKAGSTLPGSCR